VTRLLLVVDDERQILTLIEGEMTKHGFQVVTADRGEAALDAFRNMHPGPDLVLVDVVMPGMSGPMLIDRLRELDPSLPVLFMSGFHERQVVQRYVLEQGYNILNKPFTLRQLRDTVKQSLEMKRKGPGTESIH
jgi:two-component system cell cycle sensor histidine kinase/response regulator CckA